MSGITLSVKDLQLSHLPVISLIVLKTIYAQDEALFKELMEQHISASMLKDIEDDGFIKILKDWDREHLPTVKDVALRVAADKLFDHDNSKVTEVLTYLNSKVVGEGKRGFSVKSSANKKFVHARLEEEYSVQDLKDVIDFMVKDWKGTSMEQYLRPETLFNATKFEGYFMRTQKAKGKGTSSIIEMV